MKKNKTKLLDKLSDSNLTNIDLLKILAIEFLLCLVFVLLYMLIIEVWVKV